MDKFLTYILGWHSYCVCS